MKKALSICLIFIVFLFLAPIKSYAIEDPLSHANNKFGIHILFPSELQKAAQLVNTNNGDWGYVVIPIQVGDKDLVKWQNFMNDCAKYHLIPIIRLATEGDYFNTQVWRKPDSADVLDFANFLNSLDWPTKNRYVIVFNEVNRGDEWGGTPNPTEYAQLLSYAVTVFKTRNPDFFIISSGMDNAAANANGAMNEYTYYEDMQQAVPGIFNQIDGMSSHSYPNPGFSSPPSSNSRMSIDSFAYEEALLDGYANKTLPVFITETGWSQSAVGEKTAADDLVTAYNSVWNDPHIVTVAPFLLDAGAGPFSQFSFLDSSGNPNDVFKEIASLPKIKGQPTLNPQVLAASTSIYAQKLPTESFNKTQLIATNIRISPEIKMLFKWLLQLPI